MSDTGGRKGAAKWAVGATATARVLDLDPSARRCRATLKKTLVASKLPPLLRLEVRATPRTSRGSTRLPWEPFSSSMITAWRYLWPCVPTARARARGLEVSAEPGVRCSRKVSLSTLVQAGTQSENCWETSSSTQVVLQLFLSSTKQPQTCKSKLATSRPMPVWMQDAAVGARAHGTVTGATALGVFVAFYNGLSGLVHARALGLAPDQTPEDAFKTGQASPAPLPALNPLCHRVRTLLSLVLGD